MQLDHSEVSTIYSEIKQRIKLKGFYRYRKMIHLPGVTLFLDDNGVTA